MPEIHSTCRTAVSRLLPAALVCGFGFYAVDAGDPPLRVTNQTAERVDATTRRVVLHDGDSVLLEYPDWLTTVKSLDPKVIRVSAVRPNCLRIQSVAQGTAILRAVDRGDHQYSIEVTVRSVPTGER